MGIHDWFTSKTKAVDFLRVDIHSHLLPGIDDGVKTPEESADIIKKLQKLGIEKIITTPHVMQGYYENTPDIILAKLKDQQAYLNQAGIDIELAAAAEYFLDENFIKMLDAGDKLLTIGEKYLLFETAFLNKPLFLEETIFKIKSRGLIPLMAHPERYTYLLSDPDLVLRLQSLGCEFQVNLRSMVKNNNSAAKDIVKKLFKHDLVSFLGSDVHNERQLADVVKVMNSPLFDKQKVYQVKNNQLL